LRKGIPKGVLGTFPEVSLDLQVCEARWPEGEDKPEEHDEL
jgi:hypothetical protein